MGHYSVSTLSFFQLYISVVNFRPPSPPQCQLGKTVVCRDMATFTDNCTKSHLPPHNYVVSEPFRRKIASQLVAAEMSSITSEKLKEPKWWRKFQGRIEMCRFTSESSLFSLYLFLFFKLTIVPFSSLPFLYFVENLTKKPKNPISSRQQKNIEIK